MRGRKLGVAWITVLACVASLTTAESAFAALGDMSLLTTNAAGVKGNGHNQAPSWSADGQRVAFDSLSDNLDPADLDPYPDIYVKDIGTGDLYFASTDASGANGDGASFNPSLSGNGNLVAFQSMSTNLSSLDTDQTYDVFVKNLTTGQVTLVSETGGVKGALSAA